MKLILRVIIMVVVIGVIATAVLRRLASPKKDESIGSGRASDRDDRAREPEQAMLKLYLRKDNCIAAYWEAWLDGEDVVEHWGQLGERGQIRKHPRDECVVGDEAIRKVLEEPLRRGYQAIAVDVHAVLLIEYRVDAMGTVEDLEKRHALQDRMDETLGWTGLGNCDGGSIGSGTMEVCCFVVDFEAAQRVIADDLEGTSFADYTRIYREDAD